MRFKLDENLPQALSRLLQDAGHDVATVREEGIAGCEDQSLYKLCCAEQRVLVTLDMDFAHPLRFPPEAAAGIIVLRPPRPLLSLIRSTLAHALNRLTTEPIAGRLWIIESAFIRIYEPQARLEEE